MKIFQFIFCLIFCLFNINVNYAIEINIPTLIQTAIGQLGAGGSFANDNDNIGTHFENFDKKTLASTLQILKPNMDAIGEAFVENIYEINSFVNLLKQFSNGSMESTSDSSDIYIPNGLYRNALDALIGMAQQYQKVSNSNKAYLNSILKNAKYLKTDSQGNFLIPESFGKKFVGIKIQLLNEFIQLKSLGQTLLNALQEISVAVENDSNAGLAPYIFNAATSAVQETLKSYDGIIAAIKDLIVAYKGFGQNVKNGFYVIPTKQFLQAFNTEMHSLGVSFDALAKFGI